MWYYLIKSMDGNPATDNADMRERERQTDRRVMQKMRTEWITDSSRVRADVVVSSSTTDRPHPSRHQQLSWLSLRWLKVTGFTWFSLQEWRWLVCSGIDILLHTQADLFQTSSSSSVKLRSSAIYHHLSFIGQQTTDWLLLSWALIKSLQWERCELNLRFQIRLFYFFSWYKSCGSSCK